MGSGEQKAEAPGFLVKEVALLLEEHVGCSAYVCMLLVPEACGTHLYRGLLLESNTQY